MKIDIGDYVEYPNQRKIDIQINPWDIWSLDHTLAMVILPSLKEFRKDLIGYPSEFIGMAEWENVIDSMILSFELIIQEFDQEIDVGAQKEHTETIQKGLLLFGKYFRNLWQ